MYLRESGRSSSEDVLRRAQILSGPLASLVCDSCERGHIIGSITIQSCVASHSNVQVSTFNTVTSLRIKTFLVKYEFVSFLQLIRNLHFYVIIDQVDNFFTKSYVFKVELCTETDHEGAGRG